MVKDIAERQFLEEAAWSYPSAVLAVNSFRDLVQAICRKVVEARLEAYGAALRVHLSQNQLLSWQSPKANLNGPNLQLGVCVKASKDAAFYHVLYWDIEQSSSPALGAAVYVYLTQKNQEVGQKLSAQSHDLLSAQFTAYKNEIWLWQPLKQGQIGDFEMSLGQILDHWIGMWDRIGGLVTASEPDESEVA